MVIRLAGIAEADIFPTGIVRIALVCSRASVRHTARVRDTFTIVAIGASVGAAYVPYVTAIVR